MINWQTEVPPLSESPKAEAVFAIAAAACNLIRPPELRAHPAP